MPNNFAAYAERIRDGVQQKMQAKSGPELLVGTAIVILRLTNVSRSLMQQRNIAMLNGPKLSRTDNFLYVFGLASTLVGLTINGIELNRRVRAGQSLLEIQPVEELDPAYLASNLVDTSVSAVVATRGTTLFKRRELSSHGRVLRAISALAATAYAGFHVAGVAKAR